jgi:anti-anti-sigma factor
MAPLARIKDEHRDGVAIAHVDGEIDASNTAWLEARLRALLTNQSTALAADLSAVTYLDSAGIAMLFRIGADLRVHQQQLHIVVADGSPIARMIRLTGLDTTVPTHPSLEAALTQLGLAG